MVILFAGGRELIGPIFSTLVPVLMKSVNISCCWSGGQTIWGPLEKNHKRYICAQKLCFCGKSGWNKAWRQAVVGLILAADWKCQSVPLSPPACRRETAPPGNLNLQSISRTGTARSVLYISFPLIVYFERADRSSVHYSYLSDKSTIIGDNSRGTTCSSS